MTTTDKTSTQTTQTTLTNNPFGFAVVMNLDYGVLQPEVHYPLISDDQHQFGLAVAHFPNNYLAIREALEKDRADLPNMGAFVKFCRYATETALKPDEGEMATLFGHLIDPEAWDRSQHRHGQYILTVPPGMLPPLQKSIKPDMVTGIDPFKLRKRQWIAKHLPGYVRNRLLIGVNGLVEYKSGEGNMATAVSLSSEGNYPNHRS